VGQKEEGVNHEGTKNTKKGGEGLRYLSVCSGIEAATVAWHPLGFVPVAFSEIESFPCAVLQHHYPTVPNLGDMARFKEWPDYAIDVLVGGTPCQSFSVAGLRKGLADPRGNLALVFLGIVDRYRPGWVVWENVPGVHSSWSDVAVRAATERCGEVESGARRLALEAGLDGETIAECGGFEEAYQSSDFDCFLAGLEELGYGVASTVLDAQFFGVAQRRERVFVVGHIGGEWQRAAAVLFERAGLCGHPAPRRTTGQGVARSAQAGFGVGGEELGKSLTGNTGGIDREDRHTRVCADVSAIPINMQAAGKCGDKSPNMLGVGNPGDPSPTLNSGDRHAVGVPVSAVAFQPRIARNGRGDMGDVVNALSAQSGETGKGDAAPCVAIAFSAKDSGADAQTEVSPTLRALNHDQSHANSGWSVAVAHSLKADGFDASEDGTGRGTPLVPEICGTLSDGAHMGGGLTGRTPTPAESSLPPVAWALQERDSKGTDSDTKEGHLIPTPQGGFFNMAVRRLTPRECERLQGFPDDYTLLPSRKQADGPRYKALGNSMAVPVMAWIGKRILEVEAIK
jgi:DNA (cytosine-5)-methyltransferase 1